MTDASGFVARAACPACAFPVGIRAAERKKQRVRCPVCGAHASVTVEAPASDGPFREGVESLALVPSRPPPADPPSEALIEIPPPLYSIARPIGDRRLLWLPLAVYLVMAFAGYLAGTSLWISSLAMFLAIPGIVWGRTHREHGWVDGKEFVRWDGSPWSRTDRISLRGASVRVEPLGSEHHVVLIENGDARLDIGGESSLSLDVASAIAERLQAVTDESDDR